jgi:hypothetical protein
MPGHPVVELASIELPQGLQPVRSFLQLLQLFVDVPFSENRRKYADLAADM